MDKPKTMANVISNARMAFFAALAGAQGDLNDPTRNASGQVRGRKGYRYADLESVVTVLRSALPAHGLAFYQYVDQSDGKVSLVTVVGHEAGHCVTTRYPMAWPNGPQEQGSAITYARRYTLMTFFGLAPSDDDGQAAQQASRREVGSRQPMRAEPQRREQQRRDPQPPPQRPAPDPKPRFVYKPADWVEAAKPFTPDEVEWFYLGNGRNIREYPRERVVDAFTWAMTNADRVSENLKNMRDGHRRAFHAMLGDLMPAPQGSDVKAEERTAHRTSHDHRRRLFVRHHFKVESFNDIKPRGIFGRGVGSMKWLVSASAQDKERALDEAVRANPAPIVSP